MWNVDQESHKIPGSATLQHIWHQHDPDIINPLYAVQGSRYRKLHMCCIRYEHDLTACKVVSPFISIVGFNVFSFPRDTQFPWIGQRQVYIVQGTVYQENLCALLSAVELNYNILCCKHVAYRTL